MSSRDLDSTIQTLPDPESLAEALLDAATKGTFERELALAQAAIEAGRDEFDPPDLFRYRLLCFDVAQVSTTDPIVRHRIAVDLLHSAFEAGDPAWKAIRASGRFDEIERQADAHASGLELLELIAYAPDEGMRGFAVSQIESAGMRALDLGIESRAFERLLHAIGASANAYRLESARKQRLTSALRENVAASSEPSMPAFRLVAIAGGHAQLRGTAARLLQQHGIETVPIPSSREAVRRERDIVRLLQGCDLAMLLVRQITHSTSDQVRKAAERLGVPVVYSNALSAVAIERQLFELQR